MEPLRILEALGPPPSIDDIYPAYLFEYSRVISGSGLLSKKASVVEYLIAVKPFSDLDQDEEKEWEAGLTSFALTVQLQAATDRRLPWRLSWRDVMRSDIRRAHWKDQQLIIQAVGLGGAALVLSEGRGIPDWILAALYVAVGIRGARAGVVSTSEYLEIRNLFSTHRAAWDRIDRFEIVRFKLMDRPVVAALLKDGSVLRIGHFCSLSVNDDLWATGSCRTRS